MLYAHVPSAVAGLTPQGRLPATRNLRLAIGLPLRNQAILDELLQQLYDPQSANFHKFLTPQEFTARFGPTDQDYQAVIRFAEANGLTVVGQYPNRVVLDVTGGVSNIEQAFMVTLRTYRHPTEARECFAPDREPSVPANLPVADLWGLSDYGLPRPLARKVDSSNIAALNYNGSGPGGSYQGRDFRNAYAPGTSLSGAGQIAAVVAFDGYYANDITSYESQCGYSNVPLQNVLVDGVSGIPGYSGVANAVAEVSMDIELVIAMAPGLSKLIVYEGSSPYDVFNRIVTNNLAKQVSCSWAWYYGPTHTWGHPGTKTLDSQLRQMAAQGQAFFQASGDSDAYTGSQALNSSTGPIPVDSIYVTSVGGTTLTMNGVGVSWASEKVWNWGGNIGSGGGISPNYTIPSWQTNVSMAANSGSTVYRNIPDVALTADAVHVVYNNGSSGTFGGTSCAAPLWSGFCALVNQQSSAANGTSVGSLNPALYSIAAGAGYTNCFHDITTGNNIGTNTPGLYYAVTNYDLATGLGTPNGTNLINALAPPAFPYFIAQPGDQTVPIGASLTFSAAVGGQPPFSYQWLFNGTALLEGGNISGTTSNVLAITAATTDNVGTYSLVVTNSFGATTSSGATLTVVFPPTITGWLTNQTVECGGNVTFNATVSGTAPLSYQWSLDGTPIFGAAGASLSLSNVHLPNHTVTLVVTNAYGSAASNVVLSVHDTLGPVITLNGDNPSYVELGSPFNDPGATANDACAGSVPVLATGTVNTSAVGTNALVYTADDGSENTNLAVRTVVVRDTTPPSILWSFTSLVLTADTNCSAVTPDLTGTSYIHATDLSGALMISQSPPEGAVLLVGTNLAVITVADVYGNAAHSTNAIVVQDQAPPLILSPPQSQTNITGSDASFEVTATACTPLAYQWLFDGAPLTGQTNSTLRLVSVTTSLAGDYAVVVSASGGSTTSIVATLTVDSGVPTLSTTPMITAAIVNPTGSFTLQLAGAADHTYVLEATTSLIPFGDWQPVATNTFDASGAWQYTERAGY